MIYHIIRESREHAHLGCTGSLPSSALGGRGGRVAIVISDATVGNILVDFFVADPMRRDLVERVAREDLVGTTSTKRGKETTIGIAQQGRNLCPLLLSCTVH